MASNAHEPKVDLQRRLATAIAIAVAASVLEVVGSWLSGSLALLSDASHVGTDALALGLSLWALRLSSRAHTPRMSFGYHRLEVLAALANGILLVAIAGYLGLQAYARYLSPPLIQAGIMFSVGLAGLVANLAMLVLLKDWAKQNINARGAFLHAYGDTLGSVGVVVAAVLIQITGIQRFDMAIAAFIVFLILFSAWRLLRDTVRIVLEATPAGFKPAEIAKAIEAIPGVKGVHDLHVWTVTSGLYALTGHVVADASASVHDASHLVGRVQAMLRERFGIAHATLQVDSLQHEIIASSDVEKRP
ncbi:MAG: cation diffusion facilitator family transporter [Thermoplasmata archaeon]